MAAEYMLVRIAHLNTTTWRREAVGLVNGEEVFARSLEAPQGQGDDPFGFVSRVLSDLGEDDWQLVSAVNLEKVQYSEATLVLHRSR